MINLKYKRGISKSDVVLAVGSVAVVLVFALLIALVFMGRFSSVIEFKTLDNGEYTVNFMNKASKACIVDFVTKEESEIRAVNSDVTQSVNDFIGGKEPISSELIEGYKQRLEAVHQSFNDVTYENLDDYKINAGNYIAATNEMLDKLIALGDVKFYTLSNEEIDDVNSAVAKSKQSDTNRCKSIETLFNENGINYTKDASGNIHFTT